MSVKIIRTLKGRDVDCVSENKSCRNNFSKVCYGCKIYTGHGGKHNLFDSV